MKVVINFNGCLPSGGGGLNHSPRNRMDTDVSSGFHKYDAV